MRARPRVPIARDAGARNTLRGGQANAFIHAPPQPHDKTACGTADSSEPHDARRLSSLGDHAGIGLDMDGGVWSGLPAIWSNRGATLRLIDRLCVALRISWEHSTAAQVAAFCVA